MRDVMTTYQRQEDRYTISFQLRRNTSTAEVNISLKKKKSQRLNFESLKLEKNRENISVNPSHCSSFLFAFKAKSFFSEWKPDEVCRGKRFDRPSVESLTW